MGSDPFTGAGLRSVELTDRPVLEPYLSSVREPLSDYTFSQIYTWRNSLRILWKIIRGHLCVFANGSGDLTLLLPPIGDSGSDAALRDAFELMDSYNVTHGVPDRSRVEYLNDELRARFSASGLIAAPMGNDYVYDVERMIDLAGGDLKSKRQERNRFTRDYNHRAEAYDASRHQGRCLALLEQWRVHQDAKHLEESSADHTKRQKESLATELALRQADVLGLRGMVVYVDDQVRGFTFGEPLGTDQSSIVIEKTDLECRGLAQFIFSEFCRREWAHRPLVNAGDDWGLEPLAWTKMSYRPVKLMPKYVLRREAALSIAVPVPQEQPEQAVAPEVEAPAEVETAIRPARRDDIPATLELETACFDTFNLTRRQLRYLQSRPSVVFLVAEHGGKLAGEAIALVRHHRGNSITGRIYSLAVDSSCRGKGIGRQLLREMMDQLAQRGAGKVYLEVESTNASAIALYERMGFSVTDEIADYYGEGRSALHMMCPMHAEVAATKSAA